MLGVDVYDVGDGCVIIRHLMAVQRHNNTHTPGNFSTPEKIFQKNVCKFYFNVIVCMQTGSLEIDHQILRDTKYTKP